MTAPSGAGPALRGDRRASLVCRSAGGECPHRQGAARSIQLGGAVAPGAEASLRTHRRRTSAASLERACPAVPCAPARRSCELGYIYRTASLLRPARCYAPPPIFGRNYCKGLFYLHYTPPPPRAARASLPHCSSARVRVLQV